MDGFKLLAGSGALLALLAVAGCDKKGGNGPQKPYDGPLMETTNVLTLVSDSAKLKYQVTAPLMQQFESGDIIYPKSMKVTFYSADGKKTVINTLTAEYGKFDKAKNLYTMRGTVRVVNVPEQQRLNTEEMFFDRTKQLIYTDSAMFVEVTTPYEHLTGHGLSANQNFSRYRIFQPIGTFAAPQAKAAPTAAAKRPQPVK